MSLLRLLSTGKSLVGVRDNERSYNLNDTALLPKFEQKKNPFRATTLPAQPQATTVEARSNTETPGQISSGQSKGVVASAPAERISPASAKHSGSGVWRRLAGGCRGVALQVCRWVASACGGSFRRRTEVDAKRQFAQTELRLESVTVVRNDLSDTATAGGSSARGPAPSEPVETSWSRATARIFGEERLK